MKTLLLCLMLITAFTCFAEQQSACNDCSFVGTVIDSETGKPMPDVVIIAKSTSATGQQKVITDEQGQFNIPQLPSGTYTLHFQKNNYKPLEKRNLVVKKKASTLNIALTSANDNIDDYHSWLLKVDFL